MKVKELMERVGMAQTGRAIAYIKDGLDEMNMSDLQAHASTVGIIPIDNRQMLRERLLREFRKHVSSYKKPVHQTDSATHVSPEVMKILSEGR